MFDTNVVNKDDIDDDGDVNVLLYLEEVCAIFIDAKLRHSDDDINDDNIQTTVNIIIFAEQCFE